MFWGASMDNDLPPWMRRGFSAARLDEYVKAVGGDVSAAVALYSWNMAVSAALYIPLHWVEIVLRNALHRQLTAVYGREDWWEADTLRGKFARWVGKARQHWEREHPGRRAGVDEIVSELSFGFWVGLLASRHDRDLWVLALYKAFPHYGGRRDELHEKLDSLRWLRNRVMHYEPVHHLNLAADHEKIYRMLGFMEGEAISLLEQLDQTPAVLAARPPAPAMTPDA
jgi:hypothetical protein